MNPTPEPDDDELARQLRGLARLESAPEHVLQRAIGVWRAPAPSAADALLRRVRAVLTFDSGAAPALAFGQRSTSGATRQLLFSIEGRDIDLRVTPEAGSRGALWRVSGQVLGPDLQATAALSVGGYAREVVLDEMAEFRFDEVPCGECRLVLRSADGLVELPPIAIPFVP